MTGTIVALAGSSRTGTIRVEDGSRLGFSAADVLGEFEVLAVGHRVSFDVERDHRHQSAVRVFREPACAGAPGRRTDGPPDLRYVGFNQAENVRSYGFDAVSRGEATIRYFVTVDVGLLTKHHIGMQEAPALCLHRLAADLKTTPETGRHSLGEEDLLAFASTRAALQRKKPKHVFAGRRGSPPPGPSNHVR